MATAVIRPENKEDYAQIRELNIQAFEQETEADLIDKLRKKEEFIEDFSMVCDVEGEIVGHILFYPVEIIGEKIFQTISLAPMSVLPEYQNQGIGTKLVQTGLSILKENGYKNVIVLGHPDYYPKFGFEPASKFHIRFPAEVPDEAFMALELEEGSLQNISGEVKYPHEFFEE